jgi:DNA polymerase
MSLQRTRMLDRMGLGPSWRLRDAAAAATSSSPATAPASVAADGDAAAWRLLEEEIRACQACALCTARKQAVPGVGDTTADWLFIGEGPGAEEDERGEPFVGQAGRLLDAMLFSIGLERGTNVYIANVVKCRPPGNRTPAPAETAACAGFLQRQIDLIRPRLIVALGSTAAQSLLATETTVGALRGRCHDYRGIPLIVTYHPAYLLRSPLDKAKAWDDLCLMRRTMAGLDSAQ